MGDDAFSEFFRNIFGGGFGGQTRTQQRMPKTPIRGQDLEVTAQITLEEAYRGTTRAVQLGQRQMSVKIPAGAQEGTRVRLSGQGERGYAGGQPGDVYVIVSLIEHPVFRREGEDLHTDLKVPLYTAVLGGTVDANTLSGPVSLRIQSGTQSGKTIRLKGKGMPHLRQPSTFGDLYAHILIQIPTDLSDQERTLFEELRNLRS
jgi:curved DNA-binding protein